MTICTRCGLILRLNERAAWCMVDGCSLTERRIPIEYFACEGSTRKVKTGPIAAYYAKGEFEREQAIKKAQQGDARQAVFGRHWAGANYAKAR